MLVKLPIHDTTLPNSFGRSQATVKAQMPPLLAPAIARLAEGKTLEDARAFLNTLAGPPPFTDAGGMQAIDPGASGWLTLDLSRGSYVMFCAVPDPATGNPNGHFAIPMAAALADTSDPDRVVGNGTPGSCTSQAVVSAVALGGVITFDCGSDPVTIPMAAGVDSLNVATASGIVLHRLGTGR